MAQMNVGSGMFATPPMSTKILNGAGGGSRAGTMSARAPYFRINSDGALDVAAAEALAQQRFAALAADEIERQASGNRAERGHRRVQHHPLGMIHDREHDKQIVDLGKREKRGVEEGDDEESRRADAEGEGFNPCCNSQPYAG